MMYKALFIIVGSVFALLFFGIAMKAVRDAQDDLADGGKFKEVQQRRDGNSLIVSWSTDVEADGVVYYTGPGDTKIVRSTEFKKAHRVEIKDMPFPISYYIEACDLVGGCFMSKEYNATFP